MEGLVSPHLQRERIPVQGDPVHAGGGEQRPVAAVSAGFRRDAPGGPGRRHQARRQGQDQQDGQETGQHLCLHGKDSFQTPKLWMRRRGLSTLTSIIDGKT